MQTGESLVGRRPGICIGVCNHPLTGNQQSKSGFSLHKDAEAW